MSDDDKMRTVDLQVDTIPDLNSGTGGYMSPGRNSITINYKRGDERFNNWSESDCVLIHEQKHRDNRTLGMFAYPMSWEQTYKANMHNEISANICALLSLRQKYLETGDLKVFEEDVGCFKFYADAIKSGKIIPGSDYKEDFDKEMALIANGTRDMWEKKFGKGYSQTHYSLANYYYDKSGKYEQYYDQNYERAQKIAYTIGGVDFSKYMDKDVEIPEQAKEQRETRNFTNQELAEKYNVPPFDGSMSLEQYQKLVQHKLAMNKYLSSKPEFYETDKDFTNNICLAKLASEITTDNDKKNRQERGLDRHKDDYNKAFDSVDDSLVQSIVNSAARQYEGKEPPKANDTAYNKAVNEIYTCHVEFTGDTNYKGNVNLRSSLIDESKLNSKLPKYADYVQNASSFERTLRNYIEYTGASPEEARNQAHRLAGKNKILAAWGGFIGAPIVNAVTKAANKIKNMFSSESSEKTEKSEKNERINPVYQGEPQYREWQDKDGSRVSDVQHRQILDMTKDIIKKPTKSRAKEAKKTAQQEAKKESQTQTQTQTQSQAQSTASKEALKQAMGHDAIKAREQSKATMLKIIQNMNKINGADKSVDADKTIEILYQKYGPDAQDLLIKAISEPTDYARITGDASIKTSRAALEHLCNMEKSKETFPVILNLLQSKSR